MERIAFIYLIKFSQVSLVMEIYTYFNILLISIQPIILHLFTSSMFECVNRLLKKFHTQLLKV